MINPIRGLIKTLGQMQHPKLRQQPHAVNIDNDRFEKSPQIEQKKTINYGIELKDAIDRLIPDYSG